MTRLILAAAALAAFLCLPSAASAVVYVDGTGEPAFTNTTTNTQWVKWQGHSAYEQYRLEFDMYAGTNLVKTEVTSNLAPNGSGSMWVNWTGVINTLQEGNTYTICGYGRYWIGGIPSRDTGSCYDADQSGKRAATTIDRTKPSIAVKIDNGAAFSRTAKLNYHVDYSDNLAFPFPANFVCRDIGSDPAQACATATHEYNEACSVPLGGMKKVTYFNCDEDLSVHDVADGPVTFCVVAADSAIPDNPHSANQGANASQANRSDRTCDSIVIDRTAPQVTITPSATSVLVGDLVSFAVQAADATSGLTGQYAWTWGDNTSPGTGETATHTFTAPGTYEVKVATKDAAGNETTAAKVITVNPRPTTDPDGDDDPAQPTSPTAPPTTTTGGTTTTAPTAKEVAAAAGGGPVQETTVAGLEVLAPKRLKLTARTKALAVALTAEGPGKAALALVRGGRVYVKGTAVIGGAGTVGYKLRLPRKMKGGAYQLKISFTPQGAVKASTKTVKLTVVTAKKKKARKAALASTASVKPRVAGGPVAVPTGKVPKAPASRRVRLPLG